MSILSRSRPNSEEVYTVEADVILTAVMVGFSATRILQKQPFSFDIECPADWQSKSADKQREFLTEWQQFLNNLSALSEVLRINGLDPKHLKDAQSPEWAPGALITGRAGGAATGGKHMSVQSAVAQNWIDYEATNPVGYCGRGAYTGTIDDPTHHTGYRQPTKRRVITDPKRWNPNQPYWGLIDRKNAGGPGASVNLSTDPKVGMGPFRPPWNGASGVVGYTHGMSWAMREAIRRGPWCTPYEIAAGSVTTKMASCFACTTYMYAAGFPPSSIHLGRGESWAPLPEDEGDADYDRISKAINIRWNIEIHHYLKLGGQMLQLSGPLATSAHQSALGLLREAVDRVPIAEGANLMLDALTVHESEWKRLGRTLRKIGSPKRSSSMFA